jgi:hypothetical protein
MTQSTKAKFASNNKINQKRKKKRLFFEIVVKQEQ